MRKRLEGPCSVDGCDEPIRHNDLCYTHYHRKWRNGDFELHTKVKQELTCKAPDCVSPVRARGLCAVHWSRVQRTGSYELQLPIVTWSRKYERCIGCGTDKWPHVGKGLCSQCGKKTWQSQSKDALRERLLRRHYGLTPEDFDRMWEAQEGKCKICKRFAPTKLVQRGNQLHHALHVDHDHKAKKVRGLLCDSCNRGLGFFFDDPEILISAAAYLTAWRESLVEKDSLLN